MSLFGVKVEKPFDLREELQSIFEPILVELRRLSERPRKIERLRSELLYYQQRLDVANAALQSLTAYREKAPPGELRDTFQQLEDRWRKRRDDLQNRVNLTQFELQQTLSPDNSAKKDTWETIKKLFGGRLLNLLLAVLAMVTSYAILNMLTRLYRRLVLKDATFRRAFITRVGSLSFYLLTTLIVMLSGMAVFYVRGDWVLLGLFLIILAGAAWAVQKSLPRFLTEAKLILNLGPVREGERVMFNGLPWQVTALNFQATLENPCLQGGKLHLPIRELVSYHSRKFDAAEPWFPSKTGDWVVLDDDTYGQVKAQTPEVVELQVFNAIKTYPVQTYLAATPYNLSRQGFTLYLTFGLDYQHQVDITGDILEQLKHSLEEALSKQSFSPVLQHFDIWFDKADNSSLNYVVELSFDGEAASQYLQVPRTMQKLLVETCNEHNWIIPFEQLVVHRAEHRRLG